MTVPRSRELGSRIHRAYQGRHTALVAGAHEEPGALPLPAWGTFLGIALGVIGAVSGTIYAVLFGADGRWVRFVLAVLWGLLGGAVTVASVRLRRDEPINPVVIGVGAVDALLGGIYLVSQHATAPGGGLVLLALLTGAGVAAELRTAPEPADPAGPIGSQHHPP